MHKDLENIRQRPGMYLGSKDNLYTTLLGYISGYEAGFAAGMNIPAGTPVAAGDLAGGQSFHRFVAEHYGQPYPYGKKWQDTIREHAGSEQNAFRLFFELLAAYEQSQPAALKTRVRQLLCAKPFQPFVIRMTDDTEHHVANPSFVLASPNERSSIILEKEHEDQMLCLSPSLIRSVEPSA